MADQKPSIGRIVHYTVSTQEATEINRRRGDGARSQSAHREKADGSQVHVGNSVAPGDVFPMVITRTWGNTPESAVNGQVMLDGNDLLWVTSAMPGEGERHFVWPPRV